MWAATWMSGLRGSISQLFEAAVGKDEDADGSLLQDFPWRVLRPHNHYLFHGTFLPLGEWGFDDVCPYPVGGVTTRCRPPENRTGHRDVGDRWYPIKHYMWTHLAEKVQSERSQNCWTRRIQKYPGSHGFRLHIWTASEGRLLTRGIIGKAILKCAQRALCC